MSATTTTTTHVWHNPSAALQYYWRVYPPVRDNGQVVCVLIIVNIRYYSNRIVYSNRPIRVPVNTAACRRSRIQTIEHTTKKRPQNFGCNTRSFFSFIISSKPPFSCHSSVESISNIAGIVPTYFTARLPYYSLFTHIFFCSKKGTKQYEKFRRTLKFRLWWLMSFIFGGNMSTRLRFKSVFWHKSLVFRP